jgi:AcrR family transcriptional regulator
VSDQPGLRERKKQRTRETISSTAISLFLETGFDQVSVAEVAEAAEVSKRTLFAYFPRKEDLVMHRLADHETESARVVRERPARQAPLTALRNHFAAGLGDRDPITGLNDRPEIVALAQMVLTTPALTVRMLRFNAGAEAALADALRATAWVDPVVARLVSAQIVAVRYTLSVDNSTAMAVGLSADERYPAAVAAADQGFDMLRDGVKLG